MVLSKKNEYLAKKKEKKREVTFATNETCTFTFPVCSGRSYLSCMVGSRVTFIPGTHVHS